MPVDAKNVDSKVLCSWIVSFRAVGILKEKSKEAMGELLKREQEGDSFDYNEYINQKLKEVLPDKNMDLEQLITVVSVLENDTFRRK